MRARAWGWGLAAAVPALAASVGLAKPPAAAAPGPDFNREVRPILARHCLKCHGPDDKQRQAGLRLDTREGALAALAGGRKAVVPGKPQASTLVQRIHARGAGVMPPPATKNPLSEADRQVLVRWIAAGARYEPHWAFVPPRAVAPPAVRTKGWVRNPVDTFVLARLEAEGLRPAPEADRYTLVRRVSLDLIGLPPTPEEADAFVNDPAPHAYERLVDRLLASPQYGERWARRWLDLARYADTNGYEKDRPRSIWPYRDWVIRALNADLPFDQFTVEQIAGDLMPNATPEQRIATGFHRNTMLNEEGGIDPLEFRFHAVNDRVATTGTVWLGLTIGCAQCHTHKYDPILQKEYYGLFAFLNNAEEPEMEVASPDLTARRAEAERRAAELETGLADRFPLPGAYEWRAGRPLAVTTEPAARTETLPDQSVLVSGTNPDAAVYTVTLDAPGEAAALRLEALTHPSLGGGGPGRTAHGNFVLGEVTVRAGDTPVKLVAAEADFTQDGFAPARVFDGNRKSGWAIHGPGKWNVDRALVLHFEKPVSVPAGTPWTVVLDQHYGGQHTLGRFRLSLGRRASAGDRPAAEVRREHRERRFAEWLRTAEAAAAPWTPLRPSAARSNLPLLTIEPDGAVFASGDQSKRDVYEVELPAGPGPISALRLEALPDPRLPRNGPGRIYYEGPFGDFHLSEVALEADGKPVKIGAVTQSFGAAASATIDGNPQTGWSVNGGQGRAHTAVFRLAEPLTGAAKLKWTMVFERYYAAGLGRFRLSVTGAPNAAAGPPPDVEELLALPAERRTPEMRERLFRHWLSVAPELAAAREEIAKARAAAPAYPTTLVFSERPPENPRVTHLYHRGEFLQPRERVAAAVPAVLHPFPAQAPRDRLHFARWLVDPRNPLVGRVTVNRQWAALFGKGLVRTTEDFGLQGEAPSHPALLDWLAARFTGAQPGPELRPWSLKSLHRLLVTSAAYRQAGAASPALLAKDPQNRLLARGPSLRLEAEMLRDAALRAAGLLSGKMYGPSVFPPQPPGVTSEGTYGPLAWTVSQGEDRYRRGLYTFTKRTAPYAMFLTFDAPSGEACVARREVSNTPLQALTLLNDAVFVEAHQALGGLAAARPGSAEERVGFLFRRCLTRPPTAEETALLARFYHAQRERLAKKELDAKAIGGAAEGDLVERAAWTLVARALLNLDEAIVKP